MNFEEKIDVLLTTYNSNIEYLKLQIDSILKQTYQNIHLIISDDCSNSSDSEELKKVLNDYLEKDQRITLYFQKENLGYIKNFEFLMEHSDGDYIAFADHDDIWYEDKISTCLNVLKENHVDLVYSDCKQIDENGNVIKESYLKSKNMPIVNGKNNILTLSRHIAIGCSTLFTKKIKEQMLPFNENTMAQDWQNVYLASKQDGIKCIEKPLFEYRLHTNNQFGGRSLKQNLTKWKEENGNSYKAFKKYRNERVIKNAYLDGSLMCIEYRNKLNLEKSENENRVIDYYNSLLKTKIINLRFIKYYKYLSFKGIGKRKTKEIMLFHFPLLSYVVYRLK